MLDQNAMILVVDDMKLVRNAVKRHLNSLGYGNVIEADNGAEAVNRFKDNPVALIFMDMVMPIMSGLEALKKIREINHEVPITILSSVADQKNIDDCKTYGILDYILKPLNASSGPETIKRVLEKAAYTQAAG